MSNDGIKKIKFTWYRYAMSYEHAKEVWYWMWYTSQFSKKECFWVLHKGFAVQPNPLLADEQNECLCKILRTGVTQLRGSI